MSVVKLSLNEERGTVLVFLALSIVMLVMMIGLAIDTARLGVSHQKQSRTTEYLALASIEAYMAETAVGTLDQVHIAKMNAAIDRIAEIGGLEANKLHAAYQDNRQVKDAADIRRIDDASAIPRLSSLNPDEAGMIIPMKWWFAEPGNGGCGGVGPFTGTCPCNAGVWRGQCGEYLSRADIAAGTESVSAIEVRLRTYETNPIRTVFARIMDGLESFRLFSRAISAIVPRHGVFAIDMSRSIAEETHIAPSNPPPDWSAVAPAPALNAMQLRDGGLCAAIDLRPGTPLARTDFKSLGIASFVWDGDGAGYAGIADQRPPNLTPPASLLDNNIVFKDDFACHDVDVAKYTGTGVPPPEPTAFLVQSENTALVQNDPMPRLTNQGVFDGPEPLNSILGGINVALNIMKDYSVPGDRIMVLGFDQDMLHTRVIGPTFPGEPEFDELLEITDLENITVAHGARPATNFMQRLNSRILRGMFPRDISNSDLPEALLLAYRELASIPGAESADSWIAIFSDGISNCAHYSNGTVDGTRDRGRFLSGTHPNFAFRRPDKSCFEDIYDPVPWTYNPVDTPARVANWERRNRRSQHRKSMNEAITIINGDRQPLRLPSTFTPLSEADISVHTFLFGAPVQPHTLVLKANSGCMSDAQAREGDHPFTHVDSISLGQPGSYVNFDANNPYHQPNEDFYDGFAKPSNGYHIPVRPSCDDVSAMVDNACIHSSAGLNVVDTLDAACDASSVDVGDPATDTAPGDIVDGAGRLVCDPECRSSRIQVEDAIRKLFEDNPFVLVEGVG